LRGVDMCNIAGYSGNRHAAPTLIEMMKKEEAFAGGYYTGLATFHEGKIYHAKVIGDVETLLRETDVINFPGTTGIIHSRSRGKGDAEWGHPFYVNRGGEAETVYVANGSVGCCKPRIDEFSEIAKSLFREGYELPSMEVSDPEKIRMGENVHVSDVMCKLIQRNMDRGLEPAEAMGEAFCAMPSEIVGLMMTRSLPNSIVWSRLNMPMWLGFSDNGLYMATTALAFPDSVTDSHLLPEYASGVVTADSYTVKPYLKRPIKIAPIDTRVTKSAYEKICEILSEGDKNFADLYRGIDPLFPMADCTSSEPLAYDVLQSLDKEGALEVRTVTAEKNGLSAPEHRMYLKNKKI
jgi:glucosamine 6-phosphate synthetase-like amidotransferase/phosphosugar isomerase protein